MGANIFFLRQYNYGGMNDENKNSHVQAMTHL